MRIFVVFGSNTSSGVVHNTHRENGRKQIMYRTTYTHTHTHYITVCSLSCSIITPLCVFVRVPLPTVFSRMQCALRCENYNTLSWKQRTPPPTCRSLFVRWDALLLLMPFIRCALLLCQCATVFFYVWRHRRCCWPPRAFRPFRRKLAHAHCPGNSETRNKGFSSQPGPHADSHTALIEYGTELYCAITKSQHRNHQHRRRVTFSRLSVWKTGRNRWATKRQNAHADTRDDNNNRVCILMTSGVIRQKSFGCVCALRNVQTLRMSCVRALRSCVCVHI